MEGQGTYEHSIMEQVNMRDSGTCGHVDMEGYELVRSRVFEIWELMRLDLNGIDIW